jgi:hypothetical protein
MARRKPVSAATKAKISASLRGNKNAFQGGPKKLTAREKVANINARNKGLSPEQSARRTAVAKKLRAQARREEALGTDRGPAGHLPKMGEQTTPTPGKLHTHSEEKQLRAKAASDTSKSKSASSSGVGNKKPAAKPRASEPGRSAETSSAISTENPQSREAWNNLHSLAKEHRGIVAADGFEHSKVIHFPIYARAASFIDQATTLGLDANSTSLGSRSVRVMRPGVKRDTSKKPEVQESTSNSGSRNRLSSEQIEKRSQVTRFPTGTDGSQKPSVQQTSKKSESLRSARDRKAASSASAKWIDGQTGSTSLKPKTPSKPVTNNSRLLALQQQQNNPKPKRKKTTSNNARLLELQRRRQQG